jgi:2,3-bisphosphoglycerate-independent phosphoglycerate mutase
MISKKMRKKVILIIRDGWGYRKEKRLNAIAEASTPNTDRLMKKYPTTLLNASGSAVGLPPGFQGNSEVGHITIGSGRIPLESLTIINTAIKNHSFFRIKEFTDAIDNCKKNKTSLHLIGLLQTEGVHSHISHLFAILELCKKKNFRKVIVHAITDGRDAPVTESTKHLSSLDARLKELGFGKIASISGRYYAMDRDKRWDRTRKAYECIINADTKTRFSNSLAKVRELHSKKLTDEFIPPMCAAWYEGVKKDDSIIFFNFRTDRTRQLTQAIVEKDFRGWKRTPEKVFFVAMTQFYSPMNAVVAFKETRPKNILAELVAKNNLNQLRISETEKYAHITFFFNCEDEKPFKGEDRILIPSPKVATYDKKPEMSVYEITKKLAKQIKTEKYSLIVTNLVNGDMVGHTGDSAAIRKAVSAVDECVGRIVSSGLAAGYTILIFGDHGNAEDQTPKWRTSHTINPVPFILVSEDKHLKSVKLKQLKNSAGLKDISPTVLNLLGIKKPREMTGTSLI